MFVNKMGRGVKHLREEAVYSPRGPPGQAKEQFIYQQYDCDTRCTFVA